MLVIIGYVVFLYGPTFIHGWVLLPQQLFPPRNYDIRHNGLSKEHIQQQYSCDPNNYCYIRRERSALLSKNVDIQNETSEVDPLLISRRNLLLEKGTAVIMSSFATALIHTNPSIAAVTSTATSTGLQQQVQLLPQYDSEEVRRIAIFEKTSPSVVYIDTFVERRDSLTTNEIEVPLGSGSGFVWDKDGHIVTNYHVVQNAQTAQVTILLSGSDAVIASNKIAAATTSDPILGGSSITATTSTSTSLGSIGRSRFSSNNNSNKKSGSNMLRRVFTARIVGVDPGKDIAVLKIDADSSFLFPISVGTSKGIKVGQQAMAIGNPFGLDHTLTVGVVSGTGREVRSPIGRPITDVIQTDAAINPGNSGGPLLDSSGRLIGMNTAIYSPSGASAGIGFAIPVDAVKFIVNTLIRDGQVVRAILGISLLGSKQARTLGINTGVLVLDVPPDSPAAKAGLKGTRRTESGLIGTYDFLVVSVCLNF
jgi:S1-C subfamily serine protease